MDSNARTTESSMLKRSVPKRSIAKNYQDPLELIWIETAHKLGIRVERDSGVFASWDGAGMLRIGTPETLDADDSVAQMIFHELCHALIEGPEAFSKQDWGLINDFEGTSDSVNSECANNDFASNEVREHACLRLQAALADQFSNELFSLRSFFAATTDFRSYFDSLPEDPLSGGNDPAIAIAIEGWERAWHGPWNGPLKHALEMTAGIGAIIHDIAPERSLWLTSDQ